MVVFGLKIREKVLKKMDLILPMVISTQARRVKTNKTFMLMLVYGCLAGSVV